MYVHLKDIDLYDCFCGDPTADNFFELADGALPVYLEEDEDGEVVFKTSPGRLERPFGQVYVLHDSNLADRIVVVRH